MKSKIDGIYLVILTILAIFIWFRDTAWMTSSDDTLPILVALPLFFWIGMPWSLQPSIRGISNGRIVFCTALFLLGIAINSTLMLTFGWTFLLWTWLSARVNPEKLPSLKKLLILPMMAFPWVSLDADRVGWWFRLSGAWAAEKFFWLTGADVSREGTILILDGISISIEVACAGLNTLQSMIISGSVVAYLLLGHTRRYWWNLPLLVVVSWLANTARIILISSAAVFISPKFALGWFHQVGGWAVLVLTFCLCWFIFSLQVPKNPESKR
jgi:exosortase/archaeosortase family protein